MDQIKIGNFIKETRKEQKLTQSDLAEKLNVSDRAISKWENGQCMPDVSKINELCEILKITINDLFSGEIIDMKDNEKKLEENILELAKLKEDRDKELLTLEYVIGILSIIILLSFTFIAAYLEMSNWLRITLIIAGFIIGLTGLFIALRLEQVAGYYECNKCHRKYVPTYNSVLWAMHIGRTRYMKCPKCNKWSWQKKKTK